MSLNKKTHVFGVPLRKTKYRRQVLIGGISHAYGSAWEKAITSCGIRYTHCREVVGKDKTFASRTSRAIDCMACIAARCEP